MSESLLVGDALGATTESVRLAYGASIGRRRDEVVTPALILDLPAAQRNIAKMAQQLTQLSCQLRPHIKVHKSRELAQMQIEAGAIGVSVATVWEAAVMVRSGLDGVFVVNEVAGPEKLAVLAELARDADVLVAVDEAGNAAAVAAAARMAESTLGVMIEVDTGMDRAGVDTVREAVELGKRIADMPGVRLRGVTGYEGHCSLTPERDLRRERQVAAMDLLVEAADSLRADGLSAPVVSAGGTATWDWTAAHPGITEIQAGSYVVMDNFHGAMVGDFETALTVLTTVISRRPERVIVDAGNKSMGAPQVASMRGHDLDVLRFDEEHGIFEASADSGLAVGDVVELIPGYAPGTVNWYDAYHVVQDDRVVDIWPVIPRGPGHGGLLR